MLWRKNKKKDHIIFCNSWPKSGTHLLLNMASIILNNKNDWYKDEAVKSTPNDVGKLINIISERVITYKHGFAMKGHIGYNEDVLDFFLKNNIQVLFIIRDPRDVICSTVRWVTDLRKNWDANNFFKNLTKEEQLSYAINGMPDFSPFNDNDSFVMWDKPIKERYKHLTPWTESGHTCVLKYEELSGNLGKESFIRAIDKVISFLGIEDEKTEDLLKNNLIDKKSATFHSGKSGGWKNDFTDKNINDFIKVGGEDLVKKFNYEPSICLK
ncbi:sulfotransferase domain-containing protein [Hyunsoonleella aestuarii]|uniref:Sulfotransferase domain-containing protein n=1 Tax=Hyunsoonleella aestuarii TaxID=912802 RepID=A0ABP8E6Z4_9FLAO|nr:sulfotransferase domain-containing protein [Hyunsoonleella aestuarii]